MCRVRAKILVSRKLGPEEKKRREPPPSCSFPFFARPESSLARDTWLSARTGTLATQAIISVENMFVNFTAQLFKVWIMLAIG